MVVFGAFRGRFQCTLGRFCLPVPTVSLLLLSFLLVSCREKPAATPGLTQVVLQTDWYPQPEHGGFYTALVEGYYKAEGLAVTIQPGGPYMQPYQQVAAGAAQFGMGGSDKILESVAS